jgi:hypothetical protein
VAPVFVVADGGAHSVTAHELQSILLRAEVIDQYLSE